MNEITLIVPPKKVIDFISLMEVSFTETDTSLPGKLKKGGLTDVNAALEESWVRIKKAVKTAIYDGWEAAKSDIESVSEFIKQTADDLGKQAEYYRDRLIEKIQEAMAGTYQMVLGSLKKEILVGDMVLPIKAINVEYKLSFSGSLEISLTNLCKIVASGDIVVKGSYGVTGTP